MLPSTQELIVNDGLYLIRVATGPSSAQHVVAALPAVRLEVATSKRSSLQSSMRRKTLNITTSYKGCARLCSPMWDESAVFQVKRF